MRSLCETCQNVRVICTERSRFLLCELSLTNAAYPKYPPQPVVFCDGYQTRERAEGPGREEQKQHGGPET